MLWTTVTEPAGGSHPLQRIYYINAITGKRSRFNAPDSKYIGVERSLQLVKAAPQLASVSWLENGSGNSSGTYEVIEGVYIQHEDKFFWKYSVTEKSHAKVVFTVVVNAASSEVEIFNSREDFERWLTGNMTLDFAGVKFTIGTATPPLSKEQVERKIREIESSLEKARQGLSELRKLTSPSAPRNTR